MVMKNSRDEVKGLRKFELYRTFCRSFTGSMVPIRCCGRERKDWLSRLLQLKGTTRYEEFDVMIEFIVAFGIVREVLRYVDGSSFVRYEIGNGLLYDNEYDLPFQLMVRYSGDGVLQGYTVIYERGNGDALEWRLVTQSKKTQCQTRFVKSMEEVIPFLKVMQKDDFACFATGAHGWNMAQVYTDASDPDPSFTVEWQCGSLMWQCAAETKSRARMINFVKTYLREGLGAAQMVMGPWRMVRWYRIWRSKGMRLGVGRWLAARLLMAKREKDYALVERLESIGVRSDLQGVVAENFNVEINGCNGVKSRNDLYKRCIEFDEGKRQKTIAYLALHGDKRAKAIFEEMKNNE